MRKLIIYSAFPVSNAWATRFAFNDYRQYGFDVEIWSTREIFYSKDQMALEKAGSKNYLYKNKFLVKIKTINEFEQKVSKIDTDTLFWVINRGPVEFTRDNHDLDLFNHYKIKYIDNHLLPYHVPIHPYLKFRYYASELKRRIYNRIYNYKRKPIMVLGTGRLGRAQVKNIFPNRFIYKSVPSLNVLWTKQKPELNSRYIVYVDEAVNHSPDAALHGEQNPCHDVNGFYLRINRVFKQIENWTGIQIVIAASGKFFYDINPFENREIFYEKTQNLIQHSEMVIGHASSGLEQAIVENKVVIILYDKGFIKQKNKKIHDHSILYGTHPIWTEKLTKSIFETMNHLNVPRYQKTLLDYLKEDEVTGSFVDSVIGAFNKI